MPDNNCFGIVALPSQPPEAHKTGITCLAAFDTSAEQTKVLSLCLLRMGANMHAMTQLGRHMTRIRSESAACLHFLITSFLIMAGDRAIQLLPAGDHAQAGHQARAADSAAGSTAPSRGCLRTGLGTTHAWAPGRFVHARGD